MLKLNCEFISGNQALTLIHQASELGAQKAALPMNSATDEFYADGGTDNTEGAPPAPATATESALFFSDASAWLASKTGANDTSPRNEALEEIGSLLQSAPDAFQSAILVEKLRGLSSAELNATLAAIGINELLNSIDDDGTSHGTREVLIRLLTADRLAELDTAQKAALVTAMQRGTTGRVREEAICRIFLATFGRELTALKNLIDGGNNEYDLHKLLFSDIDNIPTREAILAHIASEAKSCQTGQFKILSDIDDTFLQWRDTRYPNKIVYPGILQFYAELDRGTGESADSANDLVFISARPTDFLGLIEGLTHKLLGGKGIERSVVLTGSVFSSLDNRKIAAKKFQNFTEYKRLYPEYRFLFIGDSGQGDAIFADRMRTEFSDDVAIAFIHDVRDADPAERDAYAAIGVHFVDTYVGAAILAASKNVMSIAGVLRVAQGAVDAFENIHFTSPEQKIHVRWLLQRDILRIEKALPLKLNEKLRRFTAPSSQTD